MSSTKFPAGHRIYYMGDFGSEKGHKMYGVVANINNWPDLTKYDAAHKVWAIWDKHPNQCSYMPEDLVLSDDPVVPPIPVGTLVVFQFDDEPEMCMTEAQFNDYYANVKNITILAKVPWAKGQGL